MKICPSCIKEHELNGIYCSKSCAAKQPKSEQWKQKRKFCSSQRIMFPCIDCGKNVSINPFHDRQRVRCSSCKIIHEDLSRQRKQDEFKNLGHTCEKCGKPLIKKIGSGRFCSNSCSNSHIRTDEQKQRISEGVRSSEKNHEEQQRRKQEKETSGFYHHKICLVCHKDFKIVPSDTRRMFCSKECRLNGSAFIKKAAGGLRTGAGRGKQGWYKGYHCDSSWELAWVIYQLDHNVKFTRNNKGFEYEFEEEKHKYYPDFILEDGTYVEIKGWLDKKNQAKISQFKGSLIVVGGRKGIKPYLEYVKTKHGVNYIELYEGNPYNERKNICVICGKPARKIACSQKCAGILKAKNSLNDKLDATFRKKLADQQRGKLMINNGKKAMWINSYELDAFLLTGWKKGMLKREHTKI